MIDLNEVARYYEQRWRERTPSTDILDANAYNKVLWSDLTAKFPGLSIFDRPELQPLLDRIHRKLRREFPQEQWK